MQNLRSCLKIVLTDKQFVQLTYPAGFKEVTVTLLSCVLFFLSFFKKTLFHKTSSFIIHFHSITITVKVIVLYHGDLFSPVSVILSVIAIVTFSLSPGHILVLSIEVHFHFKKKYLKSLKPLITILLLTLLLCPRVTHILDFSLAGAFLLVNEGPSWSIGVTHLLFHSRTLPIKENKQDNFT